MLRMPFGKHQGIPLDRVPPDYLWWVLNNCTRISPFLRRAIEDVLEEGPPPGPSPSGGAPHPPPVDVRDVVKRWYREMAMKFHPDRTLDNGSAMTAINLGYERLTELFGLTR